MKLEEWNQLDETHEIEIMRNQEMYENISKQAAKEFLKLDYYHAKGIYIGNKHGKLFFYVLVNADTYSRQANKFKNREHVFYKFNYILCTIESLPFASDINELEKYEGINYFGKKDINRNA